jgi:hypothetical protein
MSTRILLSGTIYDPPVRRTRRSDGALFAVTKVRDTDKGDARLWTVYFNDPALIEIAEEMRSGEPIALTGPFSIEIIGPTGAPRLAYKIAAESILDVRRKRKSKKQIKTEERQISDEADAAPKEAGGDPSDALPF